MLEIEAAEVRSHRVVAAFSYWFEAFDQSARVDVFLPFDNARWDGLLSGSPASVTRQALEDPCVRLSMNLYGAPPLDQEAFAKHYANRSSSTVAGVALGVMLPLRQYDGQKLLNIGQNRFVFRPQAGVVHTRRAWSYELTGSSFLYTVNDEFFGGNQLEQAPLNALQGHVVRSFPNRWWVSVRGGYSKGGETTVNGIAKDDDRSYVLSAFSF
ncbi:MAG: transporter [Planctomycetes bacterium]|nr:transporter [Planctomycetota bacterium]